MDQSKQATNLGQVKQTLADTVTKTQQSAGAGIDQAQQAVSDTLSQAKQVATETLDQTKQAVSDSLSEAKGQMLSTFDTQKTQAAGRLGSVAVVLRQTSEQLKAQHEATFANYAQSAAEHLEKWASLLEAKDLNGLVDEIQDFAHRQPELFIVGSLAVGLLVGRFLKSSGAPTTGTAYANRDKARYQGDPNRRSDYRAVTAQSTQATQGA